MSATNRGAERIESDNYPTPAWCTRRILEAVEFYHYRESLSVFEPCGGEGAIVREVRARYGGAEITANDIRDTGAELVRAGADYAHRSDYLNLPEGVFPGYFDVGITNPPFAIAEQVVQTMLTHCGFVIVLVRQAFVGHERASWMRTNMPDTYELPERPSFASKATCKDCDWPGELVPHGSASPVCPLGGPSHRVRVARATDATDYCWLVWTLTRNRTEGRRVILPSSSPEERGVKARARKALV